MDDCKLDPVVKSAMKRIGLVLILLVFVGSVSCNCAQLLKIHHIDVGQGDCTLIVSPTGKTVLIDSGTTGKGKTLVLPHLKRLGIKRLDYVVASHYHLDHIGGLDEVMKGIGSKNIGTVLDRGNKPAPPTGKAYTDYATAASGHRFKPTAGKTINLGGGCSMKCVANDGRVLGSGNVANAVKSENDLSLAWLLVYGSFNYYTGGDCGGESKNYADLETPMAPVVGMVDAMKVDHHASNYSTNQVFLNALNPTAVIVEVGNGNTYHHPVQTVLDRLAKKHCDVYLTEKGSGGKLASGAGWIANGNILISTDGTSTFCVRFGQNTHTYPLH